MRKLKSHYFISIHNCWGFLAILMSFLIALCLSILPIPLWMTHLWPLWPVLVLVFWAAYLPKVISPWLVWFIGLLDDVMQGSLLGEHALAFILVYFLAYKLSRQIRSYSLPSQMINIGMILLVYQGVIMFSHGIVFKNIPLFILPVLISLILWPSLLLLMRGIAMRFYIQYM